MLATFADGTERPAAKRSKAERAQARLRLLRHPGRDSWRARSPTPADVPAQLFRPWIWYCSGVGSGGTQGYMRKASSAGACTIKMGTDPRTPYDVLGLENGQGDDVAIKRAYKRAIIIYGIRTRIWTTRRKQRRRRSRSSRHTNASAPQARGESTKGNKAFRISRARGVRGQGTPPPPPPPPPLPEWTVEPTEGEFVRFGTFWCEAFLLSAPVSGLRSPFSAGASKLVQAALMTAEEGMMPGSPARHPRCTPWPARALAQSPWPPCGHRYSSITPGCAPCHCRLSTPP